MALNACVLLATVALAATGRLSNVAGVIVIQVAVFSFLFKTARQSSKNLTFLRAAVLGWNICFLAFGTLFLAVSENGFS